MAVSRRLSDTGPQHSVFEDLAEAMASLRVEYRSALHFAGRGGLWRSQTTQMSFRQLLEGNPLKAQRLRYDGTIQLKIARTHSKCIHLQTGNPCVLPIFIVGMFDPTPHCLGKSWQAIPRCLVRKNARNSAGLVTGLEQSTGAAAAFPETIATISHNELNGLSTAYVDTVRGLAPTAECIVDKLPLNLLHSALFIWHFKRRVIHVCRVRSMHASSASHCSLRVILRLRPRRTRPLSPRIPGDNGVLAAFAQRNARSSLRNDRR